MASSLIFPTTRSVPGAEAGPSFRPRRGAKQRTKGALQLAVCQSATPPSAPKTSMALASSLLSLQPNDGAQPPVQTHTQTQTHTDPTRPSAVPCQGIWIEHIPNTPVPPEHTHRYQLLGQVRIPRHAHPGQETRWTDAARRCALCTRRPATRRREGIVPIHPPSHPIAKA